jgi:sporulation protein YlmC with PRC-barrel domain
VDVIIPPIGESEVEVDGPASIVMWASTLFDYTVYSHEGEKLGDVKDFMLDVRSGKVLYALLSFGAIVGMGEKVFPVPWDALTVDVEHERVVLNVAKTGLQDAPGFHKNSSPDLADPSWVREIHVYYGVRHHNVQG